MRTVGVVTTSRSDYGIYLPLLRGIQADRSLRLDLFVGGMHLAPEFGMTFRQIEADGFEAAERIEMDVSSDRPEAVAASAGMACAGFARAFARRRPDILVALGDRIEMHAAALAALPLRIPVAHLHGGELTRGAIDDALRHSMTKLSHLHFTSTEAYARRVRQLGEEPWRVTVAGALSLDNLGRLERLSVEELERRFALRFRPPPLLVTFHSTTLEHEQAGEQTDALLAALDLCAMPTVFTLPNCDTGGRIIIRKVREFVATRGFARLVENFGPEAYFSVMAVAAAMVGNSSSGIIEAPSFGLPVVNIGTRQDGRIRAANVIDVGYGKTEIAAAIQRAVSKEFRASLSGQANPYGDGRAAERILDRLKSVSLDERLLVKCFADMGTDR